MNAHVAQLLGQGARPRGVLGHEIAQVPRDVPPLRGGEWFKSKDAERITDAQECAWSGETFRSVRRRSSTSSTLGLAFD